MVNIWPLRSREHGWQTFSTHPFARKYTTIIQKSFLNKIRTISAKKGIFFVALALISTKAAFLEDRKMGHIALAWALTHPNDLSPYICFEKIIYFEYPMIQIHRIFATKISSVVVFRISLRPEEHRFIQRSYLAPTFFRGEIFLLFYTNLCMLYLDHTGASIITKLPYLPLLLFLVIEHKFPFLKVLISGMPLEHPSL